jgi:hypothetical protein
MPDRAVIAQKSSFVSRRPAGHDRGIRRRIVAGSGDESDTDPLAGGHSGELEDVAAQRYRRGMNELLAGHAGQQSSKFSLQRNGLYALDAGDDRICAGHG